MLLVMQEGECVVWGEQGLFLYLLIYFEVRHSAVSLNDQLPVERVNNFPAE